MASRQLLKMSVLVGICAVMAAPASAVTYPGYVLQDDNSTVAVNFAGYGVEVWTVNGVPHLGGYGDETLQWFWYRMGTTGPEQQVNPTNLTFDAGASQPTDRDGDGGFDTAYLLYHDAGGLFDVEITVTLDGGPAGSEQGDLAEQVTVTNTSADESLDLHFFEYADFDLGGTPNNDEVVYIGQAVDDVDEVMVAKQLDDAYMLVASDVSSPALGHVEANIGGALRGKLDDANPDDLDDTATADGDVEWAGQWNVELGPGDAFQLSKDKMITPEPATLALMGSGAVLVFFLRRRRR